MGEKEANPIWREGVRRKPKTLFLNTMASRKL